MAPRPVQLSWQGKGHSPASDVAAADFRAWRTLTGGFLLKGDNLAVLEALAEHAASRVTLAYMDPPFFTGRVHEAKSGQKDERALQEAFDDRWPDLPAYLESLAPRIRAVRALLAPHGSLLIHVDSRTSHYVKVLADEIFGVEAFASEIIWRYRRWPAKTANFQRIHDVLLRYRRDPNTEPRWNQLYEPLAPSTLATWGTMKQRAVLAESGRRKRSSSTSEPSRGVPMGDVWDIGIIAPIARERTGFPSQKPEALLERIVSALSDTGEIVLDPYAGSGTTLLVAARMGRTFVGIDQSDVALETASARFEKAGFPLAPCAFHAVSSLSLPASHRVGSAQAHDPQKL